MLKTDDFSSVFALRHRLVLGSIWVFSAENNLHHSRLGLVVSKKCARKAVDRNLMKRCLREWFRLNVFRLPEKDFIIQVRQPFTRQDFPEIEKKLRRLYLPTLS